MVTLSGYYSPWCYFVFNKDVNFVRASKSNLTYDDSGAVIKDFSCYSVKANVYNGYLGILIEKGILKKEHGIVVNDFLNNYPKEYTITNHFTIDKLINNNGSEVSFSEDGHLLCKNCKGKEDHLILPKELPYNLKIFKDLPESIFANIAAPLKIGIMIFALLIGLRLIPKIIQDILRSA